MLYSFFELDNGPKPDGIGLIQVNLGHSWAQKTSNQLVKLQNYTSA